MLKPKQPNCKVMHIEEFKHLCSLGKITDDNGVRYPAINKDGNWFYNDEVRIYPSIASELITNVGHVIWFNK